MTGISIDYIVLNDATRKLCTDITRIFAEMKNLSEIVESLDIFWDGDTSERYMEAINMDFIEAISCFSDMRRLLTLLSNAIDEYQNTEKVVEQLIGGIKL